jgi:ferric-dicitrate binding protein FerR (iron transport regulator)
MHAMTLDLNESANVTLSPESSIKNLKNSLNSKNSEAGSPIKLKSLKSLDSQPLRDNMLARKLKGQAYFSLNNLFSGIPLSLGLDNGAILAAHKANFNIQNFDSDNKTIIDVESGELAFQSNEKLVTATSGQRIILDEQSGKVIITESPSLSPFAWHKGVLAFDNTPLTDVFTIIERFYGVEINVTDNSPVEGHFTAFNLRPGSLNECLELLQASIDMKIVRKGLKTVEISEIKAEIIQ